MTTYKIARKIKCDYKGNFYHVVPFKEMIILRALDNSHTVVYKLNCFNSYIGSFSDFYLLTKDGTLDTKKLPKEIIRKCKKDIKKAYLKSRRFFKN